MHKLFSIILFTCLLILSCSKPNKFIPDISNINLDNQIIRFGQELNQLDSSDFNRQFEEFWFKYQNFNEIYFQNILGFNTDNVSKLGELAQNLISHPTNIHIQGIVDSVYKDNKAIQDIQEAFKFLKYYLPEWTPPNIYTFSSEFGVASFLFVDGTRDGLGVGLDFFLGNAIPYKQIDPSNPAFSEYISRTFNREHLASKMIMTVLDDLIPPIKSNQILDHMIHGGKKLYTVSVALPSAPDSIVHEYTAPQMNWCNENEYEIWAFLIEENVLYSTDIRKYNKLINASPTSPGMPKESPGRTANFIGYKIVKSYMDQQDIKLSDLFTTDAKTILAQSKYKPRRN